MCSRTWKQSVDIGVSAQLPIQREYGACEQCVVYACSLSDVSVIVCTDMANVYNRRRGGIKVSDCVS